MTNDDFGRPIDPGVATLTKAIKQIESGGNYDAPGKSGEFGAYQWMPGNYEAAAKKYGIDPADRSPTNQDKVAYYTLLDWKTQGKTPEQALSMWNSGSPEWEGKVGTNKMGVKYDVPAYVQKGMAEAQRIKAERDAMRTQQPAPVPQPSANDIADQENAQAHGAFFPAKTGDSPLMAGAKAVGNTIPSAFRFAGGIVDSLLHPIETVKGIVQNPIESLIPEGIRKGASGVAGMLTGDRIGNGDDIYTAARDFINDPFGQAAPAVLLGRGAAGIADRATGAIAKNKMSSYVQNIGENTAKGVPIPSGTGTNFGGAIDSAISSIAKPVIGAGRTTFGRAAETVRGGPKLTAEDFAGEILQGDTAIRATGAKVLGNLDTSGNKGIKTYDDLTQRLGRAIEENQAKVDMEYAKDTTPYKLADLTQRSKGIAPINYVQEALSGLSEFYKKARDVESAAWAQKMLKQSRGVGLTASDINLIAKKYGGEFGDKAFSKATGEPLTSVNAQAFENIRSGLKDTARGLLKDDAAKTLDRNTSDMIKVNKAAKKVLEKVNALDQRIQQRGLLTKVGRGLGNVVDVATGGLIRGFFQKILLDSNRGNKSFNSLQMEERLSANIKKLQHLERVNDSTLIRIIVDTMKAANQLPESASRPATAIKATTVFGRPSEVAR